MPIEIRIVPKADLRRWIDTVESAFADEMSDERWKDYQRVLEPDRTYGAYDGETIVGGGAIFSMRLTVPGGGLLPAAGVTAVGVLPSHRRQGMLNELMVRQLRDARARGEPAAMLWASEGSIYQRYGYGLATLSGAIDLERERSAFRIPVAPEGRVRLVERDEAASAFGPIYERVRPHRAGFIERSQTWWEAEVLVDYRDARRGRSRKFFALHERQGENVAYAIYRVKPDWGDAGTKSVLDVQEVMAADAQATQQIWRYLFGIDLIDRIQAWLGPPDHPLLLLLAEPRRLRLRLADALWLRLVDVPAALEARSYGADGSLVLEVEDRLLPELGGRWRLSVGGGRASVTATDEPAELALEVADLGSLYLGGFSPSRLAAAGRTRELVAGSRARADAIFSTGAMPWCPEVF